MKSSEYSDQDKGKSVSYSDVFEALKTLETKRRPYESVWDLVTEYVLPSRGTYTNKENKTHPERKSRFRLESTPCIAHRKLYAKIVAEMTGTGNRWFDYRVSNPDIDKLDNVRRFLQDLSDKAYSIFNKSSCRMAHVEVTADWSAYGTAGLFIDYDENNDPVFTSIPVQQLYIAESAKGDVETVYRKFKMTWTQLVEFFGKDNLPAQALQEYDAHPFEETVVVHASYPNKDYDPSKKVNTKFRFKSCFGLEKFHEIIKEGFYKRKRYLVPRFWKRSSEEYGGSPAIDALADIRLLNALEESRLQAIQLAVRPPWVMAHDSVVAPLKLVPNGVNYGGLTSEGKRVIEKLFDSGLNIQALDSLMDQKRQLINAAFFIDPLSNREQSIRTAAEVAARNNETMIGVAPFLNRYEVEYLNPLLHELLQHILETDKTLVVPEELNGLIPEIEYTGPLSKTQRGQELQANMQFAQVVQGMAQADPSILTHIDYTAMLNSFADLFGIPLEIIKTPDQIAQEKAIQAQAQMAAQQTQGMVGAADAMSKLGKAGLLQRGDLGLPAGPEF